MKKILVVIVVVFILFLCGCKNEVVNDNVSKFNLDEVISSIENDSNIVEYKNGIIEISYMQHNNFEDKVVKFDDVEKLLKLLNYSEETSADFRGPSSISIRYTNEETNEYEFKIWSNDIFEFGQLGQPCPEMNCTKFYKIKSDFNMIEYFEEVYREG